MKIYACIPTFNESANIQEITRVVDQGLRLLAKKYPTATFCIVNADSASTDDTVDKFEVTKTVTPKQAIRNPDEGKGINLLKFIDLAAQEKADYCFTIDADITSASPNWVLDLLKPIMEEGVDFVTPLYERSRFDGCITLHFAYPTIRAFTGRSIRQPIGGEFAFNRKFVQLVQATEKPDAAYTYGIDIFLTFLAASNGLKIAQTLLGRKVHTPGLGKLEKMFPQVAAAAAFMVHENKNAVRADASPAPSVGITAHALLHLPEADLKALYSRTQKQLKDIGGIPAWSLAPALDLIKRCQQSNDPVFMPQGVWVETLAAWYEAVSKARLSDIPGLAKELLPFFVLRTMGFWNEVGGVPAPKIEEMIETQAVALSKQQPQLHRGNT